MMIAQAKVTAKGQITLPVRVIRRLGIHPGDKITFEEKEDHIEIQPATKKFSALDLFGKYPELSTKKITTEDIHRIREEAWTWRYKEYLKNNPTHENRH